MQEILQAKTRGNKYKLKLFYSEPLDGYQIKTYKGDRHTGTYTRYDGPVAFGKFFDKIATAGEIDNINYKIK